MRTLFQFVRALGDGRALQKLYDARRADQPQEGNRNLLTVLVAAAMFAVVATTGWYATLPEQGAMTFLRQRQRVRVIPAETQLFRATAPVVKTCATPEACRDALRAQGFARETTLPGLGELRGPTAESATIALLETTLTRAQLGELADYTTLVYSLAGFTYWRADVFVAGERLSTFYLDRKLAPVFTPRFDAQDRLAVEILLEAKPGAALAHAMSEDQPPFVATQHEFEKFNEWLARARAVKGHTILVVSKVTLAIFVLLLFLIVDSSPETLGLALAIGFDAIRWLYQDRWLPALVGDRLDVGVGQFLEELSWVFTLYFCLQLARMVKKSIVPWLVGGALYAGAMGALAVHWTSAAHETLAFWYLLHGGIGLACAGICLRGVWTVRKLQLPWRTGALLLGAVAMSGVIVQNAALLTRPHVLTGAGIVFTFIATGAMYLLAAASFLNISTLENRVKELAGIRVKADVLAARNGIVSRFLADSVVRRFADDKDMSETLARMLTPRAARVSLVQADLRGYSQLARELSPLVLVQLLQEFYRRVVDATQAVGQVKLIGDAIFVFIEEDAATPERTTADLALEVAGLLVAETRLANARHAATLPRPLRFGIAVHVGEVVVGNLSSDTCIDYTVVGPEVNRVARLEELTKSPPVAARIGDNAVLLTPDAVATLRAYAGVKRERLDLAELGVQLRSFGDAAELWFVRAEDAAPALGEAA